MMSFECRYDTASNKDLIVDLQRPKNHVKVTLTWITLLWCMGRKVVDTP